MSAACAAIAPDAASAARSWVAGRSTRSEMQVPATATGGRIACRRTVQRSAPISGRSPSTHGTASSSRRPAASARRCASRRTALSSVKKIGLRRRPFPSSIHTLSGAVTRTSVVPGDVSSGSRMPAPVNSVCSTRRFASTSVSPSTPPDSSRIACATVFGRSGPVSAARRSRTRSISEALTPLAPAPVSGCPPAPPAPGGPPWPAASGRRNRSPPRSSFSASIGSGRIAERSGKPTMSATSRGRSPPGDGPRTTSPTFGLTVISAGASGGSR